MLALGASSSRVPRPMLSAACSRASRPAGAPRSSQDRVTPRPQRHGAQHARSDVADVCHAPAIRDPAALERAGLSCASARAHDGRRAARARRVVRRPRAALDAEIGGPRELADIEGPGEMTRAKASMRSSTSRSRACARLEGLATVADVWLDGAPLVSSDDIFLRHERRWTAAGAAPSSSCAACRSTPARREAPRPRWRAPMSREPAAAMVRTTLLGRTPGCRRPRRRRTLASRAASSGRRLVVEELRLDVASKRPRPRRRHVPAALVCARAPGPRRPRRRARRRAATRWPLARRATLPRPPRGPRPRALVAHTHGGGPLRRAPRRPGVTVELGAASGSRALHARRALCAARERRADLLPRGCWTPLDP